jgi:hypothetical protein
MNKDILIWIIAGFDVLLLVFLVVAIITAKKSDREFEKLLKEREEFFGTYKNHLYHGDN